MTPFGNYTTKAKEAVHRAHQIAVERGQNQVNPLHLLGALLTQEDSMVLPMLDQLSIDTMHLTDSVLEMLDTGPGGMVASPSFQLYVTQELAQIFEIASRIATSFNDQFVSTEHLLLAVLEHPGQAAEVLNRFRINRAAVARILTDIKEGKVHEIETAEGVRVKVSGEPDTSMLQKQGDHSEARAHKSDIGQGLRC